MVRPDEYVPADAARRRAARPAPPAPPRLGRFEGPVLVTLFVSAGIAWAAVVGALLGQPRAAIACGLMVGTGLAGALRPAWGMFFGERWMYSEEPRPSAAALVWARLVGVVLVAGGVLLGLYG